MSKTNKFRGEIGSLFSLLGLLETEGLVHPCLDVTWLLALSALAIDGEDSLEVSVPAVHLVLLARC